MISAEVDIEIPFFDVDMLEIAWHGHYVKYFEVARCALLDKIDYNYFRMRDSGYSWPVIELHIRFAQPCRFKQTIRVKATLKEWENRLKISYLVTDAQSGKRLTRGHSIQVAVDMSNGELCFVSPQILADKIAGFQE